MVSLALAAVLLGVGIFAGCAASGRELQGPVNVEIAPRDPNLYPLKPGTVVVAAAQVIVSRLTNPRGIAFDANGVLHIGEAGTISDGGRILRLDSAGTLQTLLGGLPYSAEVLSSGEDVGVSSLVFDDDVLYVVLGEGRSELSSQIIRISPDGAASAYADLSAPEAALIPFPDTLTNPFDMAIHPVSGRKFVVDAASNTVEELKGAGARPNTYVILRDDPTTTGPVPTGIAFGPDGEMYVAIFTALPHGPGTGTVIRAVEDGAPVIVVSGLTTPIDVTFGPDGAMYVLEYAAGYNPDLPPRFIPRSGRILRIQDGSVETVADGLDFPFAIALNGDGYIHVSVGSTFQGAGGGSVVRIRLPDDH